MSSRNRIEFYDGMTLTEFVVFTENSVETFDLQVLVPRSYWLKTTPARRNERLSVEERHRNTLKKQTRPSFSVRETIEKNIPVIKVVPPCMSTGVDCQ